MRLRRGKRTYDLYKTVIIICSQCGENIVERADEQLVDTIARAKAYTEEHDKVHRQDEGSDQSPDP